MRATSIRRSTGKIVGALGLAAAAVAATTVVTTPDATAAPGPAVILGDSLAANPVPVDYLAGKLHLPGKTNVVGCGSDGLAASAYAAASGRDVVDATCAGASYRTGGDHMITLAERAANAGKLNQGTGEVVILAGANDTYPHMINGQPIPAVENDLKVSMVNTINRVKQMAPNARVKIVGYPQITGPDGSVCLINNGDQTLPAAWISAPVNDAFGIIQRAGINAARETGATFVDSQGISKNNSTCAPAAQRYVAGIVDTGTAHNLPIHATDVGLRAVMDHAGRV
ncbi:GDSL-type esterase/lipase family protein [Corynebacterium anserum]|uniref:Uncharacterized protein n=1 Tax=Corynebacterium anserum TaxID=2684406 RepID=A0A7G7YMU3_9CORY|nr:GDSL-type esterase/lipase family protein [Corynebacterium anserum]MBC2681191.1 hypothetical protein [Corynebacterium anserum]QNH95813.1 hypothetical protein GP473_03205 [Corynebacterium anserum]